MKTTIIEQFTETDVAWVKARADERNAAKWETWDGTDEDYAAIVVEESAGLEVFDAIIERAEMLAGCRLAGKEFFAAVCDLFSKIFGKSEEGENG